MGQARSYDNLEGMLDPMIIYLMNVTEKVGFYGYSGIV